MSANSEPNCATGRGWIYAGVAVAIAVMGSSAQAQAAGEKTPESAHAFITQLLTTGNSTFQSLTKTGDNSGIDVVISDVASSGCNTTLYGTAPDNGKRIHRSIAWGVISQVFAFRGSIEIAGAVGTTDGEMTDGLVINTDYGPAERVAAAMDFLRQRCDPTKGGPW